MAINDHNDEHDRGDYDTSHPWLVIPYYNGDVGRPGKERPIPNTSFATGISWLCPSIEVTGVGYTAIPGRYRPDLPLSIRVAVANFGVPSAPVTVDVWWSDPATAFAKKTYIGSATMVAPGGSGSKPVFTPSIPWTPSSTTVPAHVCLLARASTLTEPTQPAKTPDPVADRHWAQLNLMTMTAASTGPTAALVWAGNPFDRPMTFQMRVAALDRETHHDLARMLKAEPGRARLKLGLESARSRHGEATRKGAMVELGPGERCPFVVTLDAGPLGEDEFAACEITQWAPTHEHAEGSLLGSIGIALFGAPPDADEDA